LKLHKEIVGATDSMARRANAELLEAVAASTNAALKTNQYQLDKGISVDLAQYRRGLPAVRWLGGRNVVAAATVENRDSFGPPIIFSTMDSLEALTAVSQLGGSGTRHPLVLHLEASEFDADGQLHFMLPIGRQDAQRTLALRSDFSGFVDAGSVNLRSGAKSSFKDHLTAQSDPYVLLSSGVTLIRGGLKHGYAFYRRPVAFDVITSARSYPTVNIKEGADQTQWYSEEKDHASLLDRLDLVALAALERLTHGPASALKATEEGHAEAQPILILSFDRAYYPVDALAAALKHWRKRYASHFYAVVVACGIDKELARSLDTKVNFDLHDGSVPHNLSSWHWDGELLELSVRPVPLQKIALQFRFGGRRHSTGAKAPGVDGNHGMPSRLMQRRRSSGQANLCGALEDMKQAFRADASPEASPLCKNMSRRNSNVSVAFVEIKSSLVDIGQSPRNERRGSQDLGQRRHSDCEYTADGLKIREAIRDQLRQNKGEKASLEGKASPRVQSPPSKPPAVGAQVDEESLRNQVGQLANAYLRKYDQRRASGGAYGALSRRSSQQLEAARERKLREMRSPDTESVMSAKNENERDELPVPETCSAPIENENGKYDTEPDLPDTDSDTDSNGEHDEEPGKVNTEQPAPEYCE
jgi:hypothetical protein